MTKEVSIGFEANESQPTRNFIRLFKVVLAFYGITLRFAETDMSVTVDVGDGDGPQTWQATMGITRGRAEQRIADAKSMQVSKMLIRMPNSNLTLPSLGTEPIGRWAALGVFQDTEVDFYIWDIDSDTTMFHSQWFVEGAVKWSYDAVEFELENILARMDRGIPRTIIDEQCNNKLYDRFCTVIEANFTSQAFILGAPIPTRTAFSIEITSRGSSVESPIPNHRIDLGYVAFLTGQLAPLKRMVYQQTGDTPMSILLAQALPFTPQPGDTLKFAYGCDKTPATCQSVFNNLKNFRGFPYVPKPEVIIGI